MSGATTYLDYSTTPADNNSPPPVGAPEGWYPSSVNDVVREMMSVIALLGQQTATTFAGLGSMAQQSSSAVSITGGMVTASFIGDGSQVTNLNASALTSGVVPFGQLQGVYDIGVSEAIVADTLAGVSLQSLVPVGTIFPWFGDPSIPGALDTTHWAICDGTRGTPDLRQRYMVGAGAMTDLVPSGGWGASTDVQGTHSHGGQVTPTAITVAQMPQHEHFTTIPWWSGGGGAPGYIGQGSGYTGTLNWTGNVVGGDQAHTHAIAGDGAHQHNVTVNPPPSYGVWFIMRVA